MRRICIVCQSWKSGGIESFLSSLLLNMDRTGLTIDIVAEKVEEAVFNDRLRAAGIELLTLSGRLNAPENLRRFKALAKERNYDLLHLNIYQGLSLAYLRLAEEAGIPVRIAHSHNTALRASGLRPLKLLAHRMGKQRWSGDATDLWACSEAAAEFMFPKALLENKGYRFVPNGIDMERFRFKAEEREALRRELGIGQSFVVGNVGRLCDQKNQTFLLEVMASLKKRVPESVLLLAGEGDAETMLKEKAARLGLTGLVIFYGVTDQVERLMWAMDVFAFPSLFEGLGIVAVEAQAAGLPVLCSERVPAEVKVSTLLDRLSLAAGAEAWAERLAGFSPGRGADDRRGAGIDEAFDIKHVAEWVGAVYRNGEEHEGA